MSLQTIVRGEARAIRVMVRLLSGPTDREFFLRMSKRGQIMRFEVEMTPEDDPVTNSDGSITAYLNGTISEANTATLTKGVADLTVYATNPKVRLVKGQVEVEDDIGDETAGVL